MITLYTATGKKVFAKLHLLNGESYIQTGLNPGLYLLEIAGDNFAFKRKVIIA